METQKTTTLSQLVNGVKREELRKSKLLAPFGWLQRFSAAPAFIAAQPVHWVQAVLSCKEA